MTPAPAAGRQRPLCLLDATLYVYRAWQARPLSARSLDRDGRAANAVSGFAETLVALAVAERPTHLLCAFDGAGRGGERNAIHPPYKRSRRAPPAALLEQLPRCERLARALGFAAFSSRRVEADDIIGHFAALARVAGLALTVVSGDKDLAQHVVGPQDRWLDFARGGKRDARAIERRFGVRPGQIPDLLALAGDASDDVPGVPGVGAPTAARLLRKWGTLELVLANLDGVARMRFRGAPRVAALLAEHAASARLSRRLTGRLDDPALPDTIDALARRAVGTARVRHALEAAGLDRARAATLAERLAAARTDATETAGAIGCSSGREGRAGADGT